MPSTATVTAKTGIAQTVTALALTGVTEYTFTPYPKSVLKVVSNQGTTYFDIQADTTLTATISGGVMAVTIS